MTYKYKEKSDVIEYNVLVDKSNLEKISEEIKEKIANGFEYQSSNIIDTYINLIDIIRGIIDENEEYLNKFLKLKSTVSFLKEDIDIIENQILLIKKELNETIDNSSKLELKMKLCNKECQLLLYKSMSQKIENNYRDYLIKILSCIELEKVCTKKKIKKHE